MVAKDFRNRAWSALNGKWGSVAVISLVYMLIVGACGALSSTGIGSVALLLITGPLTVALASIALKVIRGEAFELKDLFDGFNNFTNTFLLYLLNSIFISLWSLLFFIPGIVKSLSYSMSYYIMAEHPEMTHTEARKASMAMMEGNKWRLFCLQLSFIGWYILCGFTFGILTIWVTPYVQTATAAFYEEIKGVEATQAPETETAQA